MPWLQQRPFQKEPQSPSPVGALSCLPQPGGFVFQKQEQGRSRELTKLQRETCEAQNTSYKLQRRFQWRPEVRNPKVVGASEGNHSCPCPLSRHWLRCKPFFALGHLRKANNPSFHSRPPLLWHTDVTTNVKLHICRNFGSLLWWPSKSG